MKARIASVAATLALATQSLAAEVYEWRTYQLNSAEKAAAFDKMMAAAIAPLKREGVKSVGVFKGRGEKDGDPNWRYTLIVADSLDTMVLAGASLASDEAFLGEARDYLDQEKSDPAYERIAASSFAAFDGFPDIVKPKDEAEGRFFELRIYESHSEYKAFMKVKMFNEGELDIFEKVGLQGVFFGSALTGDNLPNLTYMLAYDSEEEKKKVWDAFRKDPGWGALKVEEQYADTVSKIVSKLLVALPYSDIK